MANSLWAEPEIGWRKIPLNPSAYNNRLHTSRTVRTLAAAGFCFDDENYLSQNLARFLKIEFICFFS